MKRLVTAIMVVMVSLLYVTLCQAQIIGTGQLGTARRGHTATLLQDGKVLIAGGDNATGLVGTAEIFDPIAVTSSNTASNPLSPRTDHTATLLSDGRVFIIGGVDSSGLLSSTEFYNPYGVPAPSFSAGPTLLRARSGHTATVLADGKILIVGGEAAGSAEIFDPATETFSMVTGRLSTPRQLHSAALLNDGRVLIAGGVVGANTVLTSAEIYDPQTQMFTPANGTMQTPRGLALLRVLHDGKVQIIGGDGEFSMEMFDPATDSFIALAHIPPHDDYFYSILVGRTRSALITTIIQQNPMLQGTPELTPEIVALLNRLDHTVTEIPQSNRALIAGGINDAGQILSSAIIVSSSAASVTTDKLDYPPGETVTITGRGFQPNENVWMLLHEEPETREDTILMSVADSQGNFTNTEFAPFPIDLNRHFTLTAIGQASGFTAQTAFKDARNLTLTFAGIGGSVTVTPSTGTVNAPVSCGGTGTNAASQTVTSTCAPNITISDNGATVTFNASAGGGSTFMGWSAPGNLSSSTCTGTTNPCSAVLGSNPTLTVTFKRNVTASVTAANKVYDGTTSVTITTCTLTGVLPGDVGNVTCTAGGATFSDKNVGNGKMVTATGITLGGSAAAKYSLTSTTATTTANITAKPITVAAVTDSKIYDGTTLSNGVPTVTPALVPSDSANFTQIFNNKNAGTNKTLMPAGAANDGNGGNNYNVTFASVNTGTITQRALTVTATVSNKVYDATTIATVTLSDNRVAGDSLALSFTSANFTDANVGDNKIVNVSGISISGTDAGNYTFNTTATATANITKADSTTTITCPANVTYTGSPLTPCSASVTGAGGLNQALTVTYTNNTDAGTATAIASFAGDSNHNGSSDSKTFTIDKAGSTTLVTCPANVTYTGSPLTPCSASVTGAGGLNQALTVNYSNNTNAGTATASATFDGDANHTGSSDSKNFAINKAPSTTTVTCPANVVYNGSAQTPCTVLVSGAGGLNFTPAANYSNNINVATATASYTFAETANHLGSSDSKTFQIIKAPVTATAGGGSAIYEGITRSPSPCMVTGAYIGDLTCANNPAVVGPNAGTTTIMPVVSGTGLDNFEITSINGSYTIEKAVSTTMVTCPVSVTYNGSAQTPCTVLVSGAGGLNLTPPANYLDNVNAGTATASYTFAETANHLGSSGSITFEITKAPVTATAGSGNGTYNGETKSPSPCMVTGAYTGDLTCANDPAVVGPDAGTTTIMAVVSGTGLSNFEITQVNGSYTINKAESTTTVTCPASVIYNGAAQTPCSVLVTGAGGLNLAPAANYSNNINAGTATASFTFAETINHIGSTHSQTFAINKAAVTATAGSGSATYDGSTKSPAACMVTGAYTGDLTCANSPASVGPNAGTTTIIPVVFGTGIDNFDVMPVNGSYVINQASSMTVVTCPASVTYNGAAQTPCSATVTGAGELNQPLAVNHMNNINAGTATASASYPGDVNHLGSNDSKNFTIDKANAACAVTGYTGTYDGLPHGATGSCTGVGGTSLAGLNLGSSFINVPGGTANWVFTDVTGNYNDQSGSVAISISKANATCVVTGYTGTYDGAAHGATGSCTGVGGPSDVLAGLSIAPTTYTNVPGGLVHWTFTNNNYMDQSGDAIVTITTAFAYDGFYSPIAGYGGAYNNTVKTFKLGSTIPIKFSAIWLSTGAPLITGIHTLQAIKYSNATDSDPPIDATPTDAASTGNQFRLTDGQWHFNLSTKANGFSAGTWLLVATLQDGSKHSVWITLKK